MRWHMLAPALRPSCEACYLDVLLLERVPMSCSAFAMQEAVTSNFHTFFGGAPASVPPDTYTLDSASTWLRNMQVLSALIDQVQEIETISPSLWPRVEPQVIALRTAFKNHQERCIALLRLMEEYADRFLSDIFWTRWRGGWTWLNICVSKSSICETHTRSGFWVA